MRRAAAAQRAVARRRWCSSSPAPRSTRRGCTPSMVRFFPSTAQHTARQPTPIKLEEEDVPPPPGSAAEEEDMSQRNLWQLPECLRIVAHLRRIGVFSESELRLQFLRCREAWLSGILDDLDQSNVYDYLKGMVSCHRTHLFDVVNQYRAIFNNDDSVSEENSDGGLLFSWAMHQVSNHLTTLQVMLPNITEVL